MTASSFLFALTLALAFARGAAASSADALVTPLADIPLPGVADVSAMNKFDHALIVKNTLFLAAKENDTVAVVDITARAFVTSLPLGAPQGLAHSQDHGLLFVTSATAGTLTAFADTPPFAAAWSASVGVDADNVRYDSSQRTVWVAAGGGDSGDDGSLTCVNASTGAILFSTSIGAFHPEELNVSPLASRLTVSVPNDATGGVVYTVDTVSGAIIEPLTWTGGGEWATPFAQHLDVTGLRLWVATAGGREGAPPAAVAVLNALDGTTLWTTPTPDMPSGTSCDDVLTDGTSSVGSLSFVACGGPRSRLYFHRVTRVNGHSSAAEAWEALGALTATTMPQSLINARALAWHADSSTLIVPVPLAPNQTARLLLFSVSRGGGGGGDDDDDDDDDGLSTGAWVGILFAVGLVAAGVGAWAGRKWGARKAPAHAAADVEAAYDSLN